MRRIASLACLAGALSLATGRAAPNNLLTANPDFEQGDAEWNLSADGGMSAVSAEAAHAGKQGLRITDASEQAGSSAISQRMAVTPGQAYQLAFWARLVSGSGLGVYVRYFDSTGQKPCFVQKLDLPSKVTEWKEFTGQSVAPEQAETAEIWIHSFAPARVVAEIDDLSFAPVTSAIQPPWKPTYKIAAEDKSRLTAADVVGPDGLVYPDWRRAGVPGGIPQVAAVVKPGFFQGLENQDISGRLQEAIRQAVAQGGGAVELPAGNFYLDRPLVLRHSGVVLRGAGRDRTVLTCRDRIPRGEVRFFPWSENPGVVGPGGVVEIQANPKDLAVLRLEAKGRLVKEVSREKEGKGWGNRFNLRVTGADLLAAAGSGDGELKATAIYGNGERFSQTVKSRLDPSEAESISPDQNGLITLVGPGKQGPPVLLAADGKRGDLRLELAPGHGLQTGDRVIVEAPATDRWNKLVGNVSTASHFRQCLYEIVASDAKSVTLNQPLRIEYPVQDGAFVQKAVFLERCGVEDLTLVQQPIPTDPNEKKPESLRYWYPVEDLWTDGVTSSYAWGCWIRGVKVVTAGRNPLYLTRSKFCEMRDCEARESLFKGGGGTGYVGLERSFDCLMDGVVTYNMRHAPDLQWGAAGNVIRQGQFNGSDAQWHAGWTNENLLEGNRILSSAQDMAENNAYGYGLFSTGPSDPLHGPEGPRNVAYHNDVSSPKDGLHMRGGNEAWIIAYNRFRIGEGFGVYGKEKSFDHIIRGNTFVIEKGAGFAVQFDTPDCTGIELIDNTFYGPIGKIAGFLHDAGQYAAEQNNRVLPYDAKAPMPEPPVPSLFEWQRSQGAKLTAQ